MPKNSFIMYHDYEQHFELLSNEELGELLRAIYCYEKTGEIIDIKGLVKMAFSFIKANLDRDRGKWQEQAERSKENGKKGGRPPKNPDGLNNNPENPVGYFETQTNPDEPTKPVTVNDNVIDNVKENILSSEHDSDGERIVEKEKPKGRTKNIYEHDNVYYKTAKWLANNIENGIAGYKQHTESQLQTWADEARKIIEVDKRDIAMTRNLLAFARNDNFWQKNILSMGKFREQYDKLLVRYNSINEGN